MMEVIAAVALMMVEYGHEIVGMHAIAAFKRKPVERRYRAFVY